MGTLRKYDIATLRRRFGCVSFVETGTGTGGSLEYASGCGFEVLHSIEIVEHLAHAARHRFLADERIHIWHGDTRAMLEVVLPALPPGPALFWLDAHFPSGADYGLGDYAAGELGQRLPLAEEIHRIRAARPAARDVLLIDDARLYVDADFGAGRLPPDWPPLAGLDRSLQFLHDAYGSTHGIVVDHADHGYVIVCPKQAQAGVERRAA